MRKVAVATSSRADYGLLYWTIKALHEDKNFQLYIIATGQHLSIKHGLTYKIIEKDGFTISHKVEMLLDSDSPQSVIQGTAIGLQGIGNALADMRPNLLLVLGDRYEIMATCFAASFLKIPIAHIHGGESTEGVIDEAFRHSMTKMSHLHFVATKAYKQRVIQLGEDPSRVFLVGATGVEYINRMKIATKDFLEAHFGFKFGFKNLLITYHPVTLEYQSPGIDFKKLLDALDTLEDTNLWFTAPNADPEQQIIFNMIKDFCDTNNHAKFFVSMGQQNYLSCLKFCDAVIGNSSSGIIEAPSLKTATINIGDRQKGRIRAKSVIDCDTSTDSIKKAIESVYSVEFQKILSTVENPYACGMGSKSIMNILANIDLDNLIKKKFYTLAVTCE